MITARPSSYSVWRPKLSVYALACALFTPILALWLRGLEFDLLAPDRESSIYILASFVATGAALALFRADHPIYRFFALHDITQITKATIFSVALASMFAFTITRLEAIPRSIPIIHAALLIMALTARGALNRWRDHAERAAHGASHTGEMQNIIVIHANRMAMMFINMVETLGYKNQRVLCILDNKAQLINRSINGYAIIGAPSELKAIIQDYEVHGVTVHKVMVAGSIKDLGSALVQDLAQISQIHNIVVDFFADIFSFTPGMDDAAEMDRATSTTSFAASPTGLAKRTFDVAVALAATCFLSPLIFVTGLAVAVDVGWPLFFWQHRLGKNGQVLRIYKFRTLPVIRRGEGETLAVQCEPSKIGALLRATRFDELPQLWHILKGEMSVVGPRPLLPRDQPDDFELRLSVPPGLSGWAQVCGGKLLNAEEKNALDLFYISTASVLFDLKIIILTLRTVFRGERRDEAAIAEARAALLSQTTSIHRWAPEERPALGSSRFEQP